ncbi:MAG: phosphatase family protein [Xanthobacteraceae bacterium]|nr:phosphatase family protein [Xanthobacteraceae bacterium]
MTMQLEPGADEDFVETYYRRTKGCPAPAPTPPNPTAPYRLRGPQVEYAAAYWLINSKLRMPTLEEVTTEVGNPPPYSQDPTFLNKEIAELKNLASRRNDPLPENYLSDFIQLQSSPFGTIINATHARVQYRTDYPTIQDSRIHRLRKTVVQTGRELARMFEIETPGLLHRHALNWFLFYRSEISPPRQARIWMALDLALYAALAAAWHYKWAAGPSVSFRQRPWEYDQTLSVLFDHEVGSRGDGNGHPRGCPCPAPGTPRHPAYPSGHSTYSAAGSAILKYFFRDTYAVAQLDKLASNIGEARLWAGVHWRTDHDFGQKVGGAVAKLIIEQLKSDCIPNFDNRACSAHPNDPPPTAAELAAAEAARRAPCTHPTAHDSIPPRRPPGERELAVF